MKNYIIYEENETNVANRRVSHGTIERIKRIYGLEDSGTPVALEYMCEGIGSSKGNWFKVMPTKTIEDRIYLRYDGAVILGKPSYAVYVKTAKGNEWKKISKDYCYYKRAQRLMFEKANVRYIETADGCLITI